MQLIFNSETDALSVVEQLYNFERVGKILIAENIDFRALELAVSLAEVSFPAFSFPIVSSLRSRLPFPRHERECTDEKTPKIYVACLSAYNAGHLHGLYIDATQEPEEIEDDIKWMLSWSPVVHDKACEEWAIHDYENWMGIKIDEYEDIGKLAKLATILEEHGKAFAIYYNYYGNDVTVEDFEEYYLGLYESKEDFVYQQWDECGQLQELEKLGISSYYINWEGIANDWFIDSYLSIKTSYQEVHVFIRH
ncbi:antirestriction protein ArdA [Nostoc sp. 'Lobaria pulmonaria (5183) cyanobiont']|uniref:antirestriction protein ArdA n=1 Tax=Nostoc sp. 'Lobaria pulmonaria (5183) cyanobiont' TaxID=1618022 RepID=UPI000CF32001|nr:antirestriction protein ArdA [Nostoc sp. 'Lobaria pulmonaria (5183) cyanobiont']AVH74403.1 antirestriction protein [Nostoc sp. 'Lobaria pulmonaria (5183) cyanobiont']